MPSGIHLISDETAYASNWKTVVAVDIGMGLVVLVGGVVLALTSAWGWLLATLGVVYLFFAGGRLAKWRRLRRQAGL